MQVRIVPVEGPVVHGKDPIDLNRQGIWRNTIRNTKIAKTVQKLQEEGIHKILIMVSTAEHAYYLKQYLPDFHVVHSGISPEKIAKFKRLGILPDTEDPNPDIDSIKQLFVSNVITKVISTMKWREGVDVVDLQCVIRADGLSGSIPTIQIGGRTSRIFEGKIRGLVIDYLDDFGEDLAHRARTRMRHYRSEGWNVEEWNV
jgi:superfamily II DNA or RNA helicase